MSVWAAIALTMTASACMNLGLVLQKRGIVSRVQLVPHGAPKFRRSRHTPIWYLGLGLMIGGYGLYAAAVSARVAPISLLQPLSASGLLVVALLAVVYLKERFDAGEWLGVGILLAGVVLLGLSARGPQQVSTGIETARYLGFFAVAVALAIGVAFAARAIPGRSELLFGILSGVLFGTGYLNTKALALAIQDHRTALIVVAACLMAFGLLGGLVALQLGLRSGRALIVTAVNLVTNQVLVVVGGLVCLGETFPQETLPFSARIIGFGGILGGILLLARVGTGNTQIASADDSVWTAESKPVSL
ncbi:MAG TPA: DMT family transporter [Planctomycetaceae bacterium]|jgi:undecaprenyl phosphate-alpha-L-ara4N flippase subunit ArnE|nr:DMT family transporter [Planctomycetaceae bacterium]